MNNGKQGDWEQRREGVRSGSFQDTGKNKERKERGRYRKTLEKERLRAKSTGSIEGFIIIKGREGRGERGSSEDKEDIGPEVKTLKMIRSPQGKSRIGEKEEITKEREEIRVEIEDMREEKKLKDMRRMMMEVMEIYEKRQEERGKEMKDEIMREMAELRIEMKKWEDVKEKMEERMRALEKRLEKKEEPNKKVEELEQRMERIERKMESTQAGNWEGIRDSKWDGKRNRKKGKVGKKEQPDNKGTKRGRGERKSNCRRVAKERSKDRGKN